MQQCPNCGASIIAGCMKCPPEVKPCRACGEPVLVEPLSGAVLRQVIREYKARQRE